MISGDEPVRLRTLGTGGWGVVDEIWPGPEATNSVARKSLAPHERQSQESLHRFQREVRILRQLHHPNIIKVLAADLESDNPWFTMPLASSSLDSELRSGALSAHRFRKLMTEVLDALAYAHGRQVIHRDLKPANILIVDDSYVVADFGLGLFGGSDSTTFTLTGAGMGTIGYCAPEQFDDFHRVDARADIYAVGTLIYEVLTRNNPIALQLSQTPREYRHIIGKCREINPDLRYLNIDELRLALENVWNQSMTEESPFDRLQRIIREYSTNNRSVREAVEIFLYHQDDMNIMMVGFGALTRDMINSMLQLHQDAVVDVVRSLGGMMDKHVPFSWIDPVVNRLHMIYEATNDRYMKHVALRIILDFGERFNRYHAGEVFLGAAASASNSESQNAIIDVINERPEATRWAYQVGNQTSFPPRIQRAIQRVVADRP